MQKYLNNVTNRNGDAMNSALVTVTTLAGAAAVLYTDNGVTVRVIPLLTDQNGYFEFYAADGRYTLTITGAGLTTQVITDVLLEDPADGSAALAAPGGAGLVGHSANDPDAVATDVQKVLREHVSIFRFMTAVQTADVQARTMTLDVSTAVQLAVIFAEKYGFALDAPGGAYKLSRTVTQAKTLRLIGVPQGPVFGLQTAFMGTVFYYTGISGDAFAIDATGMTSQGISAHWSDITIEGNKSVAGSVSGGGVNLIGDKNGETFFVVNSVFRNVQVRNTKGAPWTITGTCFLNDWYSSSGVYSASYGLTHDKGNGNPTNNNWYGGILSDNALTGLNCNGGKMMLSGTNISQNLGGGVSQNGGYLILSECDYEQNTGIAISVINSSSATRIAGGMIHKSPGTAAATGISFGIGCSGNTVDDVLFANFDNSSDRLLNFANGGSMASWTHRTQNCLLSTFPVALYSSIYVLPKISRTQTGSVSFSGTGAGIRTAVITFPSAYTFSYDVILTIDGNGIDPAKVAISIDYSTQSYTQITAKVNVLDAGYGAVTGKWMAFGK